MESDSMKSDKPDQHVLQFLIARNEKIPAKTGIWKTVCHISGKVLGHFRLYLVE